MCGIGRNGVTRLCIEDGTHDFGCHVNDGDPLGPPSSYRNSGTRCLICPRRYRPRHKLRLHCHVSRLFCLKNFK